MKLYTVVVHNLQMCMKEYCCCLKFRRGDNYHANIPVFQSLNIIVLQAGGYHSVSSLTVLVFAIHGDIDLIFGIWVYLWYDELQIKFTFHSGPMVFGRIMALGLWNLAKYLVVTTLFHGGDIRVVPTHLVFIEFLGKIPFVLYSTDLL